MWNTKNQRVNPIWTLFMKGLHNVPVYLITFVYIKFIQNADENTISLLLNLGTKISKDEPIQPFRYFVFYLLFMWGNFQYMCRGTAEGEWKGFFPYTSFKINWQILKLPYKLSGAYYTRNMQRRKLFLNKIVFIRWNPITRLHKGCLKLS